MKEVGADQLGIQKFLTPAQGKIKVSELLDDLTTDYEIRGKWNPRVRSHVKALKDKLGQWRAAFLAKQQVDAYIRDRQLQGRASAKINNELQLLRQAYLISEAVGNGPKIRKLPVNNAREGFFERPDFEALVNELPGDLKDYARFGYLTGWRHGEISSLSWADLDMAPA
jgi:integrase